MYATFSHWALQAALSIPNIRALKVNMPVILTLVTSVVTVSVGNSNPGKHSSGISLVCVTDLYFTDYSYTDARVHVHAYTVLFYVCSFNTTNFSQKPFFKSHSLHGRLPYLTRAI